MKTIYAASILIIGITSVSGQRVQSSGFGTCLNAPRSAANAPVNLSVILLWLQFSDSWKSI